MIRHLKSLSFAGEPPLESGICQLCGDGLIPDGDSGDDLCSFCADRVSEHMRRFGCGRGAAVRTLQRLDAAPIDYDDIRNEYASDGE